VANRVLAACEDYRLPGESPPAVKVDVIGIGAGVVDTLVRRTSQCTAIGVDAGASPTSQPAQGPGYSKLRDQLWFGVRDWLRVGTIDPRLDVVGKLESELVAPMFSFDERGRRKVEPKTDTKKRLGRSPDFADALALAVYEPPMGTVPDRVSTPRRAIRTGGY
jgi:phage terminase large subunit